MYEYLNGTERLVGALERAREDPGRMMQLSQILFYCEDQLVQDIQALNDYVSDHREKEKEE